MCGAHYTRWRKGERGNLLSRPIGAPKRDYIPCDVPWCRDTVRSHGLCNMHRSRLMEHGHPLWRHDTCSICGGEFRREFRRSGAKVCNSCKYKRCEECGCLMARTTQNADQKFCSYACYGKSQRVTIRCENCNETFIKHGANNNNTRTRFCSRTCYQEAGGAARPQGRGDCVICGRTFERNSPAHVMCVGCAREKKASYRAMKRAVADTDDGPLVLRRAIFVRDGWICQICGEGVDRNCKPPDPRAPTLDHIIPVACGGSHLPHNLQTAHLSCNAKKRHGSAGSQLLLALDDYGLWEDVA